MAAPKYIRNNAGRLAELAAIETSAGVGDAEKVVATNTDGVLDHTLINAVSTSAGAGDVDKIPALDATGKLDNSFMPVGVGADTASIQASENLAAGDLVNVWDNAGAFRVRKADATTQGKEAHGFVLSAVTSGNNATVYFEGSNTQVSGLTAGYQYLQTSAGTAGSSAPSGSGNVVQLVGYATAATVLNFQSGDPVTLA